MSLNSADRPTRRRPLLLAMAGGAVAVTGVGVAARSGLLEGDPQVGAGGVLQLSGGDMGVQTLELPLADDVLARTAPGRWGTAALVTSTHSMVGLTWRAGQTEPQVEISSRVRGSWKPWQPVPHAHPSADGGEDLTDIVGTDLAWTGVSDGIRLRIRGSRPEGLTLVLIHPTPQPGDSAADEEPAAPSGVAARAGSEAAAERRVPRPKLRTRKDWGANESLRDGRPQYNKTIKQLHVHHTVNSNDYKKADVPALIRGMYAYHTQSLGWSDIGYNFLVDRFGRIWVGRAGGPGKNVRGAHTLGFNQASLGVSVIGNYETAAPTSAVIGGIARVAAWKLSKYDRNPRGKIRMTSEGSDRYRSGRTVRLPVIDGHRDTNQTACPGQKLYDALPKVRRRTKARMDRFAEPRRARITEPFSASGKTVDGERLVVRPGAWTPDEARPSYTWLRDGAPIAGAAGARHRLVTDDVGSRISVRVEVAAEDVEPATQTLQFADPVKARTALAVRPEGRRRRARVKVRATAPGLDRPPTGRVTVTIAGRSRRTKLVDGRADLVLRRLPAGSHDVQVSYTGDEAATAASAREPVTVS